MKDVHSRIVSALFKIVSVVTALVYLSKFSAVSDESNSFAARLGKEEGGTAGGAFKIEPNALAQCQGKVGYEEGHDKDDALFAWGFRSRFFESSLDTWTHVCIVQATPQEAVRGSIKFNIEERSTGRAVGLLIPFITGVGSNDRGYVCVNYDNDDDPSTAYMEDKSGSNGQCTFYSQYEDDEQTLLIRMDYVKEDGKKAYTWMFFHNTNAVSPSIPSLQLYAHSDETDVTLIPSNDWYKTSCFNGPLPADWFNIFTQSSSWTFFGPCEANSEPVRPWMESYNDDLKGQTWVVLPKLTTLDDGDDFRCDANREDSYLGKLEPTVDASAQEYRSICVKDGYDALAPDQNCCTGLEYAGTAEAFVIVSCVLCIISLLLSAAQLYVGYIRHETYETGVQGYYFVERRDVSMKNMSSTGHAPPDMSPTNSAPTVHFIWCLTNLLSKGAKSPAPYSLPFGSTSAAYGKVKVGTKVVPFVTAKIVDEDSSTFQFLDGEGNPVLDAPVRIMVGDEGRMMWRTFSSFTNGIKNVAMLTVNSMVSAMEKDGNILFSQPGGNLNYIVDVCAPNIVLMLAVITAGTFVLRDILAFPSNLSERTPVDAVSFPPVKLGREGTKRGHLLTVLGLLLFVWALIQLLEIGIEVRYAFTFDVSLQYSFAINMMASVGVGLDIWGFVRSNTCDSPRVGLESSVPLTKNAGPPVV